MATTIWRERNVHGICTKHFLIPLVIAGAISMNSRPAYAQPEPLTLVGAVKDVKDAWDVLKGGYDLYNFLNQLSNPDPTTAQLITAAATQISNVLTDIESSAVASQVVGLLRDYQTALATTDPIVAKGLWNTFDNSAWIVLNRLAADIDAPSTNNFAFDLGALYNILLPVFLREHVLGGQWGILPIYGISLNNDLIKIGEDAFQRNYNMVGATPVVRGSQLWNWVQQSATGFQSLKSANCFSHAENCDVFFATNPTVQAVEKAQSVLYHLLHDSAGDSTIGYVKFFNGSTGWIDPVASYENNWQGLNNAVWTSMQPWVYGAINGNQSCPIHYGAIGVWQVPSTYMLSLLCQPWPGIPAWNTGTSIDVIARDSQPPPGLQLVCGTDFMTGYEANGGAMFCSHREDGAVKYPTRGTCNLLGQDYYFDGTNGKKMPLTGTVTMLPDGNYLIGYDLFAFLSARSMSTYYYCQASTDPGLAGSAWKMGPVPGSILGSPQLYPQSFNVFAFGNISSPAEDIEGPIGAGGTVNLSGFRVNWGQRQPIGLISTGDLTLLNGTLYGLNYYDANKSLTGTTYTSMILGKPIDFESARSGLQKLSDVVKGYSANGMTAVVNGNVVLTAKDPKLNVFTVPSGVLEKTYSVTINAPAKSTVIINVGGSNVGIRYIGFNRGGLSIGNMLWNFNEATSINIASVGFPGSALAPRAAVSLSWSNMTGTLVANSISSTNQFHYGAFGGNWLVP